MSAFPRLCKEAAHLERRLVVVVVPICDVNVVPGGQLRW